jgi:hypothetical protein
VKRGSRRQGAHLLGPLVELVSDLDRIEGHQHPYVSRSLSRTCSHALLSRQRIVSVCIIIIIVIIQCAMSLRKFCVEFSSTILAVCKFARGIFKGSYSGGVLMQCKTLKYTLFQKTRNEGTTSDRAFILIFQSYYRCFVPGLTFSKFCAVVHLLSVARKSVLSFIHTTLRVLLCRCGLLPCLVLGRLFQVGIVFERSFLQSVY